MASGSVLWGKTERITPLKPFGIQRIRLILSNNTSGAVSFTLYGFDGTVR